MKKLLVTLLAASMCLSMLAGCGSDEESTTTDETTTSEATTTEESTEEEDSEAAGDVEIQDFTILGSHATGATYYEIDEFEEFESIKSFKALANEYGLELQFELVANDQYLTTLQTRFAAMNDIPYYVAMYGMSEAEVMQLAAQGVLWDVNDLLSEGDGTANTFFSEGELVE